MHPAVSKAITSYCYIIDHPKRTPKLVEVTLECTFLLIANRYVSGQAVGGKEPSMDASTAGTDSKTLSDIDLLIQSLCASADSISDIVQTFTIKCLLALTTSSICSVHEGALLKALRTIFQIHLASKHFTTRDVSKAALFDMARTVLMRLETYDSISRSEKEHLSSSLDSSQLNHEDSTTDEELTSSTSAASVFKDISKGINVDIDAILPKDDFSTFASKFHIDTYLVFRSLCKMSAKALPGDNATLDGNKFLGNTSSKLISAFSPVGSNMEDPLAYRSKILSLELILSMLESSGHAFCTGERFIFAIQN
jgi:brefeldin A-inhibited guanine nucleotide-exchange protein